MGASSYNMTKSEAIKRMINKYKEKENYYVGDIKKDQESAIKAGIKFIHAKYGFEPNLESELYIEDIKKLPELLKKEINK